MMREDEEIFFIQRCRGSLSFPANEIFDARDRLRNLATAATSAFCLAGCEVAVEYFVEVFLEFDAVIGDFTQRGDAFLVVRRDQGFRVFHQLTRALYTEVYQGKAVGNFLKAVFNGNACHGILEFRAGSAHQAHYKVG